MDKGCIFDVVDSQYNTYQI